MPTTAYNVTMLQRRLPKYAPEEILQAMDELQTIVYGQDTYQTLKLDPATGMPPFLQTQENVFKYNCPADCRRTKMVFSASPNNKYDVSRVARFYGTYFFRDVQYYSAGVDSYDATPGVLAYVVFRDTPPAATTDFYYHEYYVQPTPLTDVSIQLTLPDNTHHLMRRGVIAMLSEEDFGTSGNDEQVILRVARDIRNSLNRGARSTLGRTPIQPEYRDYSDLAYGHRR